MASPDIRVRDLNALSTNPLEINTNPLKTPENENKKKTPETPPPPPPRTNWGPQVYLLLFGGIVLAGLTLAEVASLIREIATDTIWRPSLDELRVTASANFSEAFVEKIAQIRELNFLRMCKKLSLCNEDEKEIIKELEDNFELSPAQIAAILMGGHVRLEDEGQTYEKWTAKIQNKNQRISSHPSHGQQYGVRGPLVKELLFSRIEDNDGKVYTWFQLENHPVSFGHVIRHMVDYARYRLTRMNQGPYGSSTATDARPIILKRKINTEIN